MAKYKVLKSFRDTHTKDVYKQNAEIELTPERAEEVEGNLDGSFLLRLEKEETDEGAELAYIKAELESLDVSFHPNTGIEKLRAKLEEVKGDSEKEE